MKAIRISELGNPEVMKVEDVPDPTPGAGEVLIKIRAVGVNPVDTYIRGGVYTYTPPLPYTPGIDGAGTVEAVGEGAGRFNMGNRVYTAGAISGTYAEKCLCREAQVFPLPKALSFSEGAALGVPYATAYRALFQRGRAQPGETVLIHGASGGVGIAATQLARAAGLTVIGTGGSAAACSLVEDQGAHHVLDHHDPKHLEEALAITSGRGIDIILEMLANINLGNDLPVLASGGRAVIIGSRGAVEITPRDIMGRDADILGMSLVNLTAEGRVGIHAALIAGIEAGALHPVVRREMPLQEAPQAHRDVIETSPLGKIVLVP